MILRSTCTYWLDARARACTHTHTETRDSLFIREQWTEIYHLPFATNRISANLFFVHFLRVYLRCHTFLLLCVYTNYVWQTEHTVFISLCSLRGNFAFVPLCISDSPTFLTPTGAFWLLYIPSFYVGWLLSLGDQWASLPLLFVDSFLLAFSLVSFGLQLFWLKTTETTDKPSYFALLHLWRAERDFKMSGSSL